MKRFLLLVLYSLIVTLGLGGCGDGKQAVSQNPSVIIESLVQLPPGIESMWQVEIGRRFNNAVGIIVHGGDFEQGRWIVGSSRQPWKHVETAAEVVQRYQELYPYRTIVLVSCNPGHLKLGVPGVFYATSDVWMVPDRAVTANDLMSRQLLRPDYLPEGFPFAPAQPVRTRWELSPDSVGSIFEFVSE